MTKGEKPERKIETGWNLINHFVLDFLLFSSAYNEPFKRQLEQSAKTKMNTNNQIIVNAKAKRKRFFV